MKPSIFLRVWSFFSGRPIVALRMHDGRVEYSLAFHTPWGLQAYRFPFTKIGHVILKEAALAAGKPSTSKNGGCGDDGAGGRARWVEIS